MVSELKTIKMQCSQGKELDSGPAIGVSTQNPEMRGRTAPQYTELLTTKPYRSFGGKHRLQGHARLLAVKRVEMRIDRLD
jgi:hypothetical protein